MMRKLVLLAVLIATCSVAGAARAASPDPRLSELLAQGPEALLQEADKRHNYFQDQTIRARMTVQGGSDAGKSLVITTMTKGEDRRAIRFEEPADIRGMGVVIKGRDEIYVRLPDLDKVRRVASHAKRQTFQGTDWTFDDMTMIRFSPDFTAKLAKQDDSHVVLELQRKPGVDLSYAKLVISIDKSIILIDRIEYFDDSGKNVKVQERSNPEKMPAGHLIYKKLVMRDLLSGHYTVTDVLDEKVDTGVADDTFGRRWLIRGL